MRMKTQERLLLSNYLNLFRSILFLEEFINWDLINKSFETRREDWVEEIGECEDPSELSDLLIELESAIQPNLVSKAWSQEKEDWKQKTQMIGNYQDVAQILIIFEAAIEGILNEKFFKKRTEWLVKLREIENF